MKRRILTIRIDLKDEFYYVEICNGVNLSSGGRAFGLPATSHKGKDLKEIFKRIEEYLYLR